MNMKFILVGFFFISLSAAFYSGEKKITFQDGTIEIVTPNGKTIRIFKGYHGKNANKNIEISIDEPNGYTKVIKIGNTQEGENSVVNSEKDKNTEDSVDETRNKRSHIASNTASNQADILAQIFSQYEGVIDEKSYKTILQKIEKYVEEGKISPVVLSILEAIDEPYYISNQYEKKYDENRVGKNNYYQKQYTQLYYPQQYQQNYYPEQYYRTNYHQNQYGENDYYNPWYSPELSYQRYQFNTPSYHGHQPGFNAFQKYQGLNYFNGHSKTTPYFYDQDYYRPWNSQAGHITSNDYDSSTYNGHESYVPYSPFYGQYNHVQGLY